MQDNGVAGRGSFFLASPGGKRKPAFFLLDMSLSINTTGRDLRVAVMELSQRGLKLAAKWAGEMLTGLDLPASLTDMATDDGLRSMASSSFTDEYLAAKVFFDMGEYQRAAHLLEAKVTAGIEEAVKGAAGRGAAAAGGGQQQGIMAVLNQEELFLRCYSLYLAGEKAKEERMVETGDPLDRCQIINQNLKKLSRDLGQLYRHGGAGGGLDGFNLYIYGVVLKEMQPSPNPPAAAKAHDRPSPRAVLLESVQANPLNWSAWLDLAEVCLNNNNNHHGQKQAQGGALAAGGGGGQDASSSSMIVAGCPEDGGGGEWTDASFPPEVMERLSSFWSFDLFQSHVLLEQHHSDQAFPLLERLAKVFPKSTYLTAQLALAHYNVRDFEQAQGHFQVLQARDPHRLDNLERYSDILYVKEHKAELSYLAHSAAKTDKYRAETCCIIGNYYALKGQHERAVLYFQRALKLNHKFLFAWTLIGHGYVEMRNTGAAIEAYRRAVDIDPRDHNAWYGLGQTYELLQMYFHAIYYYRKAATLRPFDARMWCALGVCYEHLDRKGEAIRCYERAMANRDREGVATSRLARLYREDHEDAKAAQCYQKHLEARGREQGDTSETTEALLFLANYRKNLGDYEAATQYCNRLMEVPRPGREQEEAKALLREIKSLEEQEVSSRSGPSGGGASRRSVVGTSGTPGGGGGGGGTFRTPSSSSHVTMRRRGGGSSSGTSPGRVASRATPSRGGDDMAVVDDDDDEVVDEDEWEEEHKNARGGATPSRGRARGRRGRATGR